MTETPTREKQEPRTLADALIEAAVEGRAAPVRIIRMDKDPDGKTFAQHFDAVKGGVVPRPDLDPPRFPTRERLEKASGVHLSAASAKVAGQAYRLVYESKDRERDALTEIRSAKERIRFLFERFERLEAEARKTFGLNGTEANA